MSDAAESNGLFVLPDGLFKFVMSDGKAYTLDLIDANIKQDEIIKADDAARQANQSVESYAWLKAFGVWVKEKTGGLELPTGQLDALWHGIQVAFIQLKKNQNERLRSMQTSPSFTAPSQPE
jgi:ribosomal protein S9